MNKHISCHNFNAKMELGCHNCNLNSLCITDDLNSSDIDKLEGIVTHPTSLAKGATLYAVGNQFRCVYIVKTGSFKSVMASHKDIEKVTGFYFPGDLIGLTAINFDHHYDSVKAIETSTVCQVSFATLEKLSNELPALRRKILNIMSKHIFDEQCMAQILTQKNAEERLATLLLRISSTFKSRGFSDSRFRLSMSRIEIASYLGLTVETVSRALSRLHKIEYILVDKREIKILDFIGMRALSQLSSKA